MNINVIMVISVSKNEYPYTYRANVVSNSETFIFIMNAIIGFSVLFLLRNILPSNKLY